MPFPKPAPECPLRPRYSHSFLHFQVPGNVACRSFPAPHVQLNGCEIFFLACSFHPHRHRVRHISRILTRCSPRILLIYSNFPIMHEHLGLQLAGSSNAPPTPLATQGSSQSGSGSSSLPSAAGPQSSGSSGPSAPRSSAQGRTGNSQIPAQQQPSQTPQHPTPQQQNQQQVAQQQVAHPPPQVQG